MIKKLLFAFLFIPLLLSGCSGEGSKKNYGENYLVIVNDDCQIDKVYIPISEYRYSLIELTISDWVGTIYKRYTYNNRLYYSDSTPFEDDLAKIKEYMGDHDFDDDNVITYEPYVKYHKCWYVYADLDPIYYSVSYRGLEDSQHDDYPTTYCASDRVYPVEPRKDYYNFLGWNYYTAETNAFFGSGLFFPTDEPRNVIMEAIWEATPFNITLNIPSDVTNPYEKSSITYTYFTEPFDLKPIESTKYYTFNGWKLDGKVITTFNPKDYAKDVTLVADISYVDFKIKYYVDTELYKEETYNIGTFKDFSMIDVPNKDHYTGSWDTTITELDNYVVNAVYEPVDYTVTFVTNIPSYSIDPKVCKYGTTFDTIYNTISYPEKQLLGLYKESTFATRINESDIVDGNMTVYLKWQDVIHVKTAAQFNNIANNKSATYILDNDIDFLGDPLPRLDTFGGVINGNGHSLFNFINQHPNMGTTNALIVNNTGKIENLTLKEGVFTSAGSGSSEAISYGFLTTTNNGTIENVVIQDCSITLTPYYNVSHSVYVTSYQYAGIFAATNNGTINNVKVNNGTVINVNSKVNKVNDLNYSDSYMRIYATFGGIVGENKGNISHASFEGTINSTLNWTESVADIYSGYIKKNYYPLRIGGIAGTNVEQGSITKSSVSGTVHPHVVMDLNKEEYPEIKVGAIVGSSSSRIQNCVATENALVYARCLGEIRAGGLIGSNEAGGSVLASLSKADYEVSRQTTASSLNIGGVAGYNAGSIAYSGALIDELTLTNYSKTNDRLGLISGSFTDGSSSIRSFAIYNIATVEGTLTYYEFGNASSSASSLFSYGYIDSTVKESFETSDQELVTDVASLSTLYSTSIMVDKLMLDNQGITVNGTSFPTITDAGYQVS